MTQLRQWRALPIGLVILVCWAAAAGTSPSPAGAMPAKLAAMGRGGEASEAATSQGKTTALHRTTAGGTLDRRLMSGGASNSVASDGQSLYYGAGAAVYRLNASAPSPGLALVTQAPLGGIVQSIAVRDHLVYLALGGGGLEIRDAGGPGDRSDEWPVVGRLGFNQIGAFASKVVLVGNRAYVILGVPGVHIVDIADPHAPRDIGAFGQFVTDVAATATTAAVVSRRLQLFDVTDPGAVRDLPELAATADAVAVVGNTLFAGVSSDPGAGQRRHAVKAWDLSNPRRPPAQSEVPIAGQARQIAIDGDRLLVPAADRLHVLNQNGGGLRELESHAMTERAQEVAHAGAMYGFAGGEIGPRVFTGASADGTRLTNGLVRPETMLVWDEPGRNIVFVEDADQRLLAFDASSFRSGPAAGSSPLAVGSQPVEAGVMAIKNGYLYLGTSKRELVVFDVRDPARMQDGLKTSVGRIAFPEMPSRLAVGDGYVFVATDPYLRVIDVHEPTRPRKVYEYTPSGGVTDLALGDGYLYVTGPMTGLRDPQPSFKVIDVRNPVRPREVSSIPAIGSNGGMGATKGYVYIEDQQTIDACAPTKLIETFRVDTAGRTMDIALGSRALLTAKRFAEGGGLVRLYDRQDPARPAEASTLRLLDAVDNVALLDDGAQEIFLAAAGEMGLAVGQVSWPAAPLPTAAPSPSPAPTAPRPEGFDARAYLPLAWRVLTGACGR